MANRVHKGYAVIPIAIGLALDGYFLGLRDPDRFISGAFVWQILPYFLCAIALVLMRSALPALPAACVVVFFDALTMHDVFIAPTRSTAALALLWMPLWNLIIFAPLTLFLTWLVLRLQERRNLTPR